MGGGVFKGATKVCVSLQRRCEFRGCGSFGAPKGSQGCPERPPGGFGKLSRSILELTWEFSEVSEGRFWRLWRRARVTNVENSMQLCAECFAKRFGTASNSSS